MEATLINKTKKSQKIYSFQNFVPQKAQGIYKGIFFHPKAKNWNTKNKKNGTMDGFWQIKKLSYT